MLDFNSLAKNLIDYKNIKGRYGKDAAVCVVFDNKFNILLEKRVINEKDPWSGQVSFPGGHFEESDVYIINTALRELKEETGIESITILGGLEVEHPRNMLSLNVYPFLCYIESFGKLQPQKDEIEYFFTPALKELKEGYKKMNLYGEETDEKCFFYGNEVIWGMTARIIERIKVLFQEH